MSDRDPVYVLNHKSNNWGWFRHEITDAKGNLWYGVDTTKGRRQWKAENCELKAKDGTTTVQGSKVDGTTPTGPDGIIINDEDPCRRGEDTLTAAVDEKKAKIARLRKLVKAECKTLRVQRGTGTAYGWVTIWANDYAAFSEEEAAAMRRLDLSPCGNCSSVCPNELDATVDRLEARAAASGDMIDMYRRACEKQTDASQPDYEGANMENQKAGLHEACPELAGDFNEIDAEFDDRIKEANRAKARRQAGGQAGEALARGFMACFESAGDKGRADPADWNLVVAYMARDGEHYAVLKHDEALEVFLDGDGFGDLRAARSQHDPNEGEADALEGVVVNRDWSHIRDSSPAAVKRMADRIRGIVMAVEQDSQREPTTARCEDCKKRKPVVGCARCGESICLDCIAERDADGGSYCASCMIALQEPSYSELCKCGDGGVRKIGNVTVCANCGGSKNPDCDNDDQPDARCDECGDPVDDDALFHLCPKHEPKADAKCDKCGETMKDPDGGCVYCGAVRAGNPAAEGMAAAKEDNRKAAAEDAEKPKALQDGQGRWWVFVPGADDEGRGVMNGPYSEEKARAKVKRLQARDDEAKMIDGAIGTLEDAIERVHELAELHRVNERWSDLSTISTYGKYLQDACSCDDGESGLIVYLRNRRSEIKGQ